MDPLAKIVAGTYEPGPTGDLGAVVRWLTDECRTGALSESVTRFCREQPEILDAADVVVENVTSSELQCLIRCRCFDHESSKTFPLEVRFTLDPCSQQTVRLPR